MKSRSAVCLLLTLTAATALAEAPVIRSVDLFSTVGEYFRAYANAYDAEDISTRYPLPANTIKPAGTNLLWDFSSGPTAQTYRFDYVNPAGALEAADFPLAKVAEKKTVEQTGAVAWLFFEQVPGIGRKVYGFYDPAFAPETPSSVFEPAIVDFPENIRYGQSWSTEMTFYSTVSVPFVDDEGFPGSASFPVKLVYRTTMTADAWGIALLPALGLIDVLRLNESQAVDISVDLALTPEEAGTYTFIETDYLRNYYWLSPGKGIVVQINSTQGSVMPDNEFPTATAFVRMFETNKQLVPIDTGLKPVDRVEAIVSNGRAFIRWSEAANATRYRVEYSTGGFNPTDWKPLSGELTERQFLDPAAVTGGTRFYRVVSLP